MDKFYENFAETKEFQSLLQAAKANPPNESSHWTASLFDPKPLFTAFLWKIEEQDRIDGLKLLPEVKDQLINYFKDKKEFTRETIYFKQLEKFKQDRCYSCAEPFKVGSSVYRADCIEHTMCKKHKDTTCPRHNIVKAAKTDAQEGSKDNKTNRDGSQKDAVDGGKNESHAHPETLQIQDVNDFLDSDFDFDRDLKEEICKVVMADRKELWFYQPDYLARQVDYAAKMASEDDSSDDDVVKSAAEDFRNSEFGA